VHVGPLAESRCLGLCDHDLAGFYARNKGRRRRAPRNGEGWHFITPSNQKRLPTPFVFPPAPRMGVHELKLDRWSIGPDGRSVDHGWVHEFRPDVVYRAGGVVPADEAEAEDEVARARTGASLRDRLVQRL
jgi:hypothetical protein